MSAPLTHCPDALYRSGTVEPPSPEGLAYSLTLPSSPASARIARAAVRTVLAAHQLAELEELSTQVTTELIACAARFGPGTDVYLSLRYRDGRLRVMVWDGHPRHRHPELAALCERHRRSALRLLAAVVRAGGGEWGFGDAREPGGGTRMWATLPLPAALRYARQ